VCNHEYIRKIHIVFLLLTLLYTKFNTKKNLSLDIKVERASEKSSFTYFCILLIISLICIRSFCDSCLEEAITTSRTFGMREKENLKSVEPDDELNSSQQVEDSQEDEFNIPRLKFRKYPSIYGEINVALDLSLCC